MLSLSSVEASIDRLISTCRGPYLLCRMILIFIDMTAYYQKKGSNQSSAKLYIYDTESEVTNRTYKANPCDTNSVNQKF